ncbi:hypothetical protein EST38_g2331 [Candolleomyces aberdarensis]|uniref:Transmembrane protein n=1 Tax=Candolleomyces aberdarensis TaxID=2316362 RepID=A0A4Q2DUV9_9AGAR|nr:hypothetical protein EST38_g2331 [Candolleomyces aberdarensis]
MPNVTFRMEDTSPLLVYSDAWTTGTFQSDNLTEQYSQSSYMYTSAMNADVFFVFNGTKVSIYGGKRARNGFYQIAVDRNDYTPVNGKTDNPESFQTPLFSSTWLSNAFHTVNLKNANAGSVVDLDYVTWVTAVGKEDEQLITNIFEDNDPSFTYEPADAWTTNLNNLGTFSGGSGHASSKEGSTMKFSFEGDAVSLYGPVGANGTLYSVSINVGTGLPNSYTTKKTLSRSNQLLYHASKLGPDRHTVTLTVLHEDGASGESTLAVDYAQVYTTPSLSGQGLSTGAVVGITLGTVAGFIALVGIAIWGVLCYIKQRHNRSFFYGFVEKSKPEKEDELSAHPFQYNTVPSGSPPPTQHTLLTQVSHGSLAATPNTGQWPRSGGQDSIETSVSQRPLLHQTSNPNVQEIIIPPAGMSEKMRRELAPRLQAPPQGTRPRQNPAALGAQNHNMSTVREESSGGSNAPNLTVATNTDNLSYGSAPPPEYTQQASAIPSTAASSFYAREAYRGH